MKIGFTDRNRNIYELKKQNSIKFGQSNAISQKKTIVQKDSDDKKKTDKNQNMGKALAVTVPTLLIGGALAAYCISKGKKKTINASKIVPKVEKEITKNDLLKDSKEVSKILKVFVAPNNGTPLKLSSKDSMNVLLKIKDYEASLNKIFTKQVAQTISPHLATIRGMLSDFLSNETKQEFEVNENCKKAAQAALNEINNFVKLLQKYESLDSIKNVIKKMITGKTQRNTDEVQKQSEHALTITNNVSIINAHTINTQGNFDYDFAGKNINNAKFVLNSDEKKYLVFDNTSDIIPDNIRKKKSGFTINGMGDSRFFAIALDGISRENLLSMIKNTEVLKQFDGDNATEEARKFFSSTLNIQELSTNEVADLAINDRVFATTDVAQQYIAEHIVIPEENPQEVIEQIAQNQDQQLTLILAYPGCKLIPQIIENLSVDLLEDDSEKEQTIRQKLIESIEASQFSSEYQFYTQQLKTISAINALRDAEPKDLISKYHALLELCKDEISDMNGNDSLFIMHDGSVKKCAADEVGSTTSNALYKITAQGDNIYINDLCDEDKDMVYKAGARTSDSEYKESLKFRYKFQNIQTKIKDIVEMSDIFDLSIVKPLLGNMKSALSLEDAYGGLDGSTKETLIKQTKKEIEEILTKFDEPSFNTKEKLQAFCDKDLSSLIMTYEYTQKDIDTLLNKVSLIDSNTIESFMDKFVLGKFGTEYTKPVYKEIVTLDGQKIKDFGYEIQDVWNDERKKLVQSQDSNSEDPEIVGSAYNYTLSDGSGNYTIAQILSDNAKTNAKANAKGKGKVKVNAAPDQVMLYRITSSKKPGEEIQYKGISKELVEYLEQDPILEALFVYNLDSRKEQEKYFKAKIANALESNPYNWADKVQNIIHAMYSFDLLSKGTDDSKNGAHEVCATFFDDGVSGGVLYIKPDGSVLANPNSKNKPNCYVLSLG